MRGTLISVYVISGLICAFAGWALIGRIGSVSPTSGQLANIESITAVVIGGISLFGGRGSILGALFGALIERGDPAIPFDKTAGRKDGFHYAATFLIH